MHDFKITFDTHLSSFLEKKMKDPLYATEPLVRAMMLHISKLLLKGGKRVRPYIAYLSLVSFAKDSRETMNILVGIELFHMFALIHDDIIDEGNERHGVPTLHRIFGKNQAILAGDIVCNWSYEALTSHMSFKVKDEVLKIFNDMINQVIVGQILDVALVGKKNATLKEIMRKTELKTAHYTFVNPMKLGMAIGGVLTPLHKKHCEKIGVALGMAFQLQDDFLDIVGSEDTTGKSSFNDLKEGQHTYFTQHIRIHGTPKDRKKLITLSNHDLSVQEKGEAYDLFKKTGALEIGKMKIASYLTQAERYIEMLSIKESHKKEWRILVEKLRTRTS